MVDDKKRRSCRIKGKRENSDSHKNVNKASKKKLSKLSDHEKKGQPSFIATILNSDKDNDIDNDLFSDSKGLNIVKLFNNFQVDGFYKISAMQQFTEHVCVHQLKQFKPITKGDTEDLRITALQWHPTNPHLFAIGGKGGTIHIHNLSKECTEQVVFSGIGPGGTIEAVKWNAKNFAICHVVTASVDGTISLCSFDDNGSHREALVCTESPMREWFCAVDIQEDGKSVYGGDNLGNLAIHHLDSNTTTYKPGGMRLHTSKIKHLEFSPRDPNLLVTASLDKSVKLWDIRKLSDRKDVLQVLEQDTAISCATFSRTDGCRLLTTDLHSELRVYKGPTWTTEQKILHPHRNFQHMTNITASWHPMADLFAIGRYPDPKITTDSGQADVRSVDVFSAASGRIVHQLMDNMSLITSLSQFNATGDLLATVQGRNFLIRSKDMIKSYAK